MIAEATLCKADMLHQFAQPDGLHAAFSVWLRRCGNNRTSILRGLFSRNAQSSSARSSLPPRFSCVPNHLRSAKAHIMLVMSDVGGCRKEGTPSKPNFKAVFCHPACSLATKLCSLDSRHDDR